MTITLVVMGVFRRSKRHTEGNFNENSIKEIIEIYNRTEISQEYGGSMQVRGMNIDHLGFPINFAAF